MSMHIKKTVLNLEIAKAGLTLDTIADRMGCTVYNVRTIISRGRCRPETAVRIAEAIGVPVEKIVEV